MFQPTAFIRPLLPAIHTSLGISWRAWLPAFCRWEESSDDRDHEQIESFPTSVARYIARKSHLHSRIACRRSGSALAPRRRHEQLNSILPTWLSGGNRGKTNSSQNGHLFALSSSRRTQSQQARSSVFSFPPDPLICAQPFRKGVCTPSRRYTVHDYKFVRR